MMAADFCLCARAAFMAKGKITMKDYKNPLHLYVVDRYLQRRGIKRIQTRLRQVQNRFIPQHPYWSRHFCGLADLLVSLPTDYGYSGNVNYTARNIRPFYEIVEVKIINNYAGADVTSPAGPAIGCSDNAQCHVIWKVDPGNNTCPCAFNISCCTNGVSVSFWWNWDLAIGVSQYRYFLDLAGIYVFYKSPVANIPMVSRANRGDNREWYVDHSLPYGSWRHVTNHITIGWDDSVL